MIQSFWHKGLKRLFEKSEAKGICADQLEKSKTSCSCFLAPASPKTRIFLTFTCTPLKGAMKGLWAVTVRANWRVIVRLRISVKSARAPEESGHRFGEFGQVGAELCPMSSSGRAHARYSRARLVRLPGITFLLPVSTTAAVPIHGW
jgi:toxin HigB-1